MDLFALFTAMRHRQLIACHHDGHVYRGWINAIEVESGAKTVHSWNITLALRGDMCQSVEIYYDDRNTTHQEKFEVIQ